MIGSIDRACARAAVLAAALLVTAAGALAGPPAAVPGAEHRLVNELRKLPDSELKSFYQRCSGAALDGRLGAGGIAMCSVGYEMLLLQRSFGGDFFALHDWSRSQPEPAVETAVDRDASIEPS